MEPEINAITRAWRQSSRFTSHSMWPKDGFKDSYLKKVCCVLWLNCFPLDLPPADPIAQLHRCFCRKLLERAVHTLIQPQSDSEAGKRKNDSGWGGRAGSFSDGLILSEWFIIGSVIFLWSVSPLGSFPAPWSSSSYWTVAQKTLPHLLHPSRLLPITPPLQVWIARSKQPCPQESMHHIRMFNQLANWDITVNMDGFSLLHLPSTDNRYNFLLGYHR